MSEKVIGEGCKSFICEVNNIAIGRRTIRINANSFGDAMNLVEEEYGLVINYYFDKSNVLIMQLGKYPMGICRMYEEIK